MVSNRIPEWENFSYDEFACAHCGENRTEHRLIDYLQRLRDQCDFPFVITSGYRCPDHPVEARKAHPGAHALGLAADIGLSHVHALHLLKIALMDPETMGVGINQKGDGRFIHLDIAPAATFRPRPHIWSY